jgi:phospholipid transport system substrate-binding protein
MKRRVLVLAISAILFVAAPPLPSAAAEGGTPSAVVEAFQRDLLGIMKQARVLGRAGRHSRLLPVIERSFHLTLMIATSSSPYWRKATPHQRQRLVEAFKRMSGGILATFFDDYDGETFETVREREGAQRTVLVDTKVIRKDDDPVNISFVVARIGERWWIIDVIVGGGISEVAVRRSEYQKLLSEGGIERLITALDKKADDLAAGRVTAVP